VAPKPVECANSTLNVDFNLTPMPDATPLSFCNESQKLVMLQVLIQRKKAGQPLSDDEIHFCQTELKRIKGAKEAKDAAQDLEWRNNAEEFERTARLLQEEALVRQKLAEEQRYKQARQSRSRNIALTQPYSLTPTYYYDEFVDHTYRLNSYTTITCVDISPCGVSSAAKQVSTVPSDFERVRAQLDPLTRKRKAIDDNMEEIACRMNQPMSKLLTVATKARFALLKSERDKIQKDICIWGEAQRVIVNNVARIS
jgi:hypothetical protein